MLWFGGSCSSIVVLITSLKDKRQEEIYLYFMTIILFCIEDHEWLLEHCGVLERSENRVYGKREIRVYVFLKK